MAILVGAAVLLGWLFDIGILKSVYPGLATMMPNTALGFVLAGISCWLLTNRTDPSSSGGRRLGQMCAFAVGAIGLLTLGEYLFRRDLGVDQWLFRDSVRAIGTSHPGRMSPLTALNFLLLGCALLFLKADTSRGHRSAQLVALPVTAISFLVLVSYTFSVRSVSGIMSHTGMAVHTALTFGLLCADVFFARPDRGLMVILTSRSVGGIMIRRLLPAAIGIPWLLGWLRLEGQRAGLYATEFGLSLMVTASTIIFALIIWWTAKRLDRMDAQRRAAEEGRFEQIVALSDALRKLDVAQPDAFFRDLAEFARQTVGARFGALWIHGREGGTAQFIPVGLAPEDAERIGQPPQGLGLLGHMLQTPGPLRLDNLASHPSSIGFPPHHPPMRSFLGVRVVFRDRVIGALYLTEKLGPGGFTALDERLVQAFAANAGVAITNARAYQDVRTARGALEHKTKELEAFTYTVSHDLKAPLRGIDGFSRVLLEDYGDRLDAEGRRYLDNVRAATRRMNDLIEDLLKYSRLERRAIRRGRVDLEALLERILEDRRPEMEARQLTIRPQLTIPHVEGEPEGLREAIANLVDNAIKFSKPGGSITVSSAVVDRLSSAGTDTAAGIVATDAPSPGRNTGYALVAVQDEGIGFDMKYHDRIFEIFQRLHRAEDYEGTGVGLAIVKKVAERHGGRAWAISELGKGSTFYLAIPHNIAELRLQIERDAISDR